MTLLELNTAFNHTYSQKPEAVYYISATNENLSHKLEDPISTSILCKGVYMLLSRNEVDCIRFWSLNEPETIDINISEIETTQNTSWVKSPISVISSYTKQGIEIQSGYNILIWGNLPPTTIISPNEALRKVTQIAIEDQLKNLNHEK
jgi:galactokinase